MYGKVSPLLVNKIAQVFTSRDFIFVASIKSEADGGIGLIDLCDENDIPEELRYDNAKEESMTGTMMQRITRKLYIIGRSSELYNQQQNKCEGQIRDLKYRLKG